MDVMFSETGCRFISNRVSAFLVGDYMTLSYSPEKALQTAINHVKAVSHVKRCTSFGITC